MVEELQEMQEKLFRRWLWVFTLSLMATISAKAVVQDVPRLQLKVENATTVPGVMGGAILHPIECDASGNVYLRFEQPNAFFEPVVKISPKGERLAFFSQESVPGWEKGHLYDFNVGPDGAIHLLVARQLPKTKKIEHAVLTFTEKGTHRSTAIIDASFTSIDRVVAFSTGEFLLLGWRKAETQVPTQEAEPTDETRKKEPPVEPVSVILDRAGNVIQQVDFSVSSPDGAAPTNAPTLLERNAIAAGVVIAGSDGNVYLMFREEKASVLVLSPRGQMVRKIEILPPLEKAVPLTLKLASGSGLLVHFAEKGPGQSYNTGASIFSVVNPMTGERMADYHSSMDVGGALACYTPSGLVFVGRREANLAILRVALR